MLRLEAFLVAFYSNSSDAEPPETLIYSINFPPWCLIAVEVIPVSAHAVLDFVLSLFREDLNHHCAIVKNVLKLSFSANLFSIAFVCSVCITKPKASNSTIKSTLISQGLLLSVLTVRGTAVR